MSTFTIPFPEYDIANLLQEIFPKKDNYSVNIPLSRQQKFYDLILMNGTNKKVAVIQVKSSRTWKGGNKREPLEYYSFFNRFDIKDNYCDYYFMYMTYPVLSGNLNPGAKWERKILVFTHQEMCNIFEIIKTKKGKKEDRFSFGFNSGDDQIWGGRGFEDTNFSSNLLQKRLKDIEKSVS